MEFCFLAGMRNYVDKNYQDQANHNPVTTENKIWLPPSFHNNNKIPIVQAPTPIAPAPKKRRINWGIADKSVWEWLLQLKKNMAPTESYMTVRVIKKYMESLRLLQEKTLDQ